MIADLRDSRVRKSDFHDPGLYELPPKKLNCQSHWYGDKTWFDDGGERFAAFDAQSLAVIAYLELAADRRFQREYVDRRSTATAWQGGSLPEA